MSVFRIFRLGSRRILVLVLRGCLWAALAAGGITALIVWRASPELPITRGIVATWFGILGGLCLVPTLVMEFLRAYLILELGEVSDPKKSRPGKP